MEHLWWYVARASGFTSWALVAASVVLGLLVASRTVLRAPGGRVVVRRNWLVDLHRFLGGLGVVFTAVHLLALVGDGWLHFGVAELLVPLASPYRPTAVAWGVVALYLLVAVEVTSLLRTHLPRRVWHGVHLLSFPLFGLASLHAVTAGTDAHAPLFLGTLGLVSVWTVALTAFRLVAARRARRRTARRIPVARPAVPTVSAAVFGPSGVDAVGGRTALERLVEPNGTEARAGAALRRDVAVRPGSRR